MGSTKKTGLHNSRADGPAESEVESTSALADSRLQKDTNGGTARASRGSADTARVVDGGLVMSAEERRRMLRTEGWLHEALPEPPPIPGYHLCWLSTTSQYDPIQKRLRLGYVLVHADELPSFRHLKMSSGDYDGCVMVNEMILSKIPQEIYQEIMTILHHENPRDEELSIRRRVEEAVETTVDSEGKRILKMEEGMQELGKARPVPTFS